MAKAMAKPGDMLFGRRTWQDFITAWGRGTMGNPTTTRMNATTKYVISTTLEDADAWQNSILLRGDAAGTVAELKARPGGDLGIVGSLRRWCEACAPQPFWSRLFAADLPADPGQRHPAVQTTPPR